MHQNTHATQMDVFVAGAGPAGLACAIACAIQGLTVHVADAMEPPIDKACGEGLLPDAVESLASLGLDLVHSLGNCKGHPLRGVRFVGDSGSSAQAVFNAQGRGIRRTVLHNLDHVGQGRLAGCGTQQLADVRDTPLPHRLLGRSQ